MKQKILLFIVFTVLIALAPAVSLLGGTRPGAAEPVSAAASPEAPAAEPVRAGEELVLLDAATGELIHLSERDYAVGAVMCEMPAGYESEALAAQALASRSYALYVKAQRESAPLPELNGAYFSVNTATLEGYMTPEQARGLWGASYDEYYKKVCAAVDGTMNEALTYEGAPIAACYHAISPGTTENSENVFASPLPYLVSADSSWDKSAEDYETTAVFTPAALEDMLRLGESSFAAAGEPESWLGASRSTAAGTVLSLEICSRDFSGVKLREYLSLRSAAFEAVYKDNEFVFTVRGYGHGVGMSQHGANELAKSGKTHAEILAHYYHGAQVTQIKG